MEAEDKGYLDIEIAATKVLNYKNSFLEVPQVSGS